MTNENKETQADKLQQLFAEVNQNDEQDDMQEVEEAPQVQDQATGVTEDDIDVLNLPPRSEVHLSSGRRVKLTLNRPLIRLLLIIGVVILILCGIYYVAGFEYFFSSIEFNTCWLK